MNGNISITDMCSFGQLHEVQGSREYTVINDLTNTF